MQIHLHIADDLLGRGKSERCGIADIEFENFRAVGDHTVRLIEDGASYFITDIVQFRRFFYHFGLYPLTNSEYIARIAG